MSDNSENCGELDFRKLTLDMFMFGFDQELDEVEEFAAWKAAACRADRYPFETIREGAQRPHVQFSRESGETFRTLNFAHFNYLGFGYHPEVITAAQEAISRYGIGAACAPILSGTMDIHRRFEQALVDFFGGRELGVSLFTSGYAANVGTLQALAGRGHHIVLDRLAHMSLLEGARGSGATLHYFDHNDADHLDQTLGQICKRRERVIVCVEGVYSADGDFCNLPRIVEVCDRYNAYILVDEAHSTLLAGAKGRGVSEAAGVLDRIDLYIATLSKSFSGVGGALIANRKVTQYVNWYAKCRAFSCALDPGVTGGMLKVLELASGTEGDIRRKRLIANAAKMRAALSGAPTGSSQSWIIPVIYGRENLTFDVADHIQRNGVDTSVMQFPSVPKNEARLRLFINSEHSSKEIEQAATVVMRAATAFNFERKL